ncbi:MAG: rod-binding protein [Gemmatimonadota bacterium]
MDLTGITQQWLPLDPGSRAVSVAGTPAVLASEGTGRPQTREGARTALRTATSEFEAVFLNQMVAAMRRTVGEGGLVRKSNAEKIFEGMLDEEWSRKLAATSGHGSLGAILYEQLSRRMGLEDDPSDPEPAEGEGPQP